MATPARRSRCPSSGLTGLREAPEAGRGPADTLPLRYEPLFAPIRPFSAYFRLKEANKPERHIAFSSQR